MARFSYWFCRRLVLVLTLGFLSTSAHAATIQCVGDDGTVIGTATYSWGAHPSGSPDLWIVTCESISSPLGKPLKLQVSNSGPSGFSGLLGGLDAGVYTELSTSQIVHVRLTWVGTYAGTDVQGPISYSYTPPPTYSTTFSLPANNTDHAITYTTVQSGNTLGTFTQQPGAPATSLTVGGLDTATPVHLNESTGGLTVGAGGVWEATPSGSYTREVGVSIPTTSPGPPAPVTSPDAPTSGGLPPAPTLAVTGDSAKAVWTPRLEVSSTGTAPGQSTSDFTTQAYREGVDKLRDADAKNNAAVLGALNSIKTSVDGVKTSVDSVASTLSSTSATTNAALAALNGKSPENQQAQDDAEASASSLGAVAKGQITSLFPNVPTAPAIDSTGSAPNFSVSLPAAFGGVTVDANPFTEDRFGVPAFWFRSATKWAVVVLLGIWVWTRISEWSRGVSTLQPAKGNNAPAGVGGPAALAVAIAVTAALVPMVTALLAWTFGDFTISAITSQSFVNPVASMPAGALWMLDQLFPVSTIIVAALARLSFNMYAAPLYMGVMAVVRFFVA